MAITKVSRGLLNTGISDSSDATAITIDSSERVMIGTTDAGYPDYGDSLTLGDVDGGGGNAGMTIRSGTSSYGTFYFSDATGTAAGTYAGKMQYNHSTNSMVFATNSSDRLTIDSSGNVGIGTTSPAAELHINDTGGLSRIRLEGSAGSADNFEFGQGTTGVTNGGFEIRDVDAATTRFVISSSGNVGIGATTVTHRLEVLSTLANYASARIITNTGTGSTEYGFISQLANDPNNTTNYLYLGGSTSTTRYVVYSNGNVANTNNSYGAYSDVKLKENIVDANPQLEKIKQLQVRNFNLKAEPDKKLIGLVAQEAETIFPKLIDETEDTENDENGAIVKTGETTKLIKYSVFVPVLIKAIQEQQEIIDDLKARIEVLEA